MNIKTIHWIFALVILVSAITSIEYLVYEPQKIYELKVLESGEGWGYEIYGKGNLIIKQDHIPGIADKKPFRAKHDAEKIGYLVIQRLKLGKSPGISKADLNEKEITSQH